MVREIMLAGLAMTACAPAAAAPLDWLVGHWCTQSGPTRTCEQWSPLRNGIMRGHGTTRRDGALVARETTTIRLGGAGAVYEASPDDAPIVPFHQVRRGRRSILFENRDHDYPQRIRYWRSGPDLMAETALADGSKARRWRYRRISVRPE